MSYASIATLSFAMIIGALLPSMSVMLVVTRSTASGLLHGAMVSAGIVAGDLVFILAAIFGLALLADAMGELFVAIRYLGGAYLVWLGISLWRQGHPDYKGEQAKGDASLTSSFLSGLFITLADQKAIFFYLGFLPAFIDLNAMTQADVVLIATITILCVGGVKLGYAWMAVQAGLQVKRTGVVWLYRLAGSVLVLIGTYLFITALLGN